MLIYLLDALLWNLIVHGRINIVHNALWFIISFLEINSSLYSLVYEVCPYAHDWLWNFPKETYLSFNEDLIVNFIISLVISQLIMNISLFWGTLQPVTL